MPGAIGIGMSLSSSLTADRPSVVAEMMVERTIAAYEAGLSALTVGDHHAQRSWYMQNTPTLGRLLAHWPDRPAGCLFLLPLWNPVLVAEHVGTLAAMVDAPFVVQVGIGAGKTQFEAFGAELNRRGKDTDESIRVVQALLAGATVGSERLGIGPVSIGLRPTNPVEWWIGGHAEATMVRAATLGTAWYGGPGLTEAQSEQLIARYRAACDDAGTTPRAVARRDALVLADGDRARTAASAIVDAGYRGMSLDQLLVGDPDDAAAHLDRLAAAGYDDVMIRCMTPDRADAVETIGLLGPLGR